jgi:hypothetical protein
MTMVDLTPGEKTVLLIAQAGGPMAPIGRWKESTLALVAKGFLKPHKHPGDPDGYFNHHITPTGQVAAAECDKEDDAALGRWIEASSATGHIQRKCVAHAEQIAVQMVDLVELSVQATGGSKLDEAKRWGEVIGKQVLEMLK